MAWHEAIVCTLSAPGILSAGHSTRVCYYLSHIHASCLPHAAVCCTSQVTHSNVTLSFLPPTSKLFIHQMWGLASERASTDRWKYDHTAGSNICRFSSLALYGLAWANKQPWPSTLDSTWLSARACRCSGSCCSYSQAQRAPAIPMKAWQHSTASIQGDHQRTAAAQSTGHTFLQKTDVMTSHDAPACTRAARQRNLYVCSFRAAVVSRQGWHLRCVCMKLTRADPAAGAAACCHPDLARLPKQLLQLSAGSHMARLTNGKQPAEQHGAVCPCGCGAAVVKECSVCAQARPGMHAGAPWLLLHHGGPRASAS